MRAGSGDPFKLTATALGNRRSRLFRRTPGAPIVAQQ
jgi:hypothetical protein